MLKTSLTTYIFFAFKCVGTDWHSCVNCVSETVYWVATVMHIGKFSTFPLSGVIHLATPVLLPTRPTSSWYFWSFSPPLLLTSSCHQQGWLASLSSALQFISLFPSLLAGHSSRPIKSCWVADSHKHSRCFPAASVSCFWMVKPQTFLLWEKPMGLLKPLHRQAVGSDPCTDLCSVLRVVKQSSCSVLQVGMHIIVRSCKQNICLL